MSAYYPLDPTGIPRERLRAVQSYLAEQRMARVPPPVCDSSACITVTDNHDGTFTLAGSELATPGDPNQMRVTYAELVTFVKNAIDGAYPGLTDSWGGE